MQMWWLRERKLFVDTHASYYADVVELVDTHALGACAVRREGSSPFIRTKKVVHSDAFFISNIGYITKKNVLLDVLLSVKHEGRISITTIVHHNNLRSGGHLTLTWI